jgi:hypothetical protein
MNNWPAVGTRRGDRNAAVRMVVMRRLICLDYARFMKAIFEENV